MSAPLIIDAQGIQAWYGTNRDVQAAYLGGH